MFRKKLDFEGSENIEGYQDADREKLKEWEDKLEVHGIYMGKECCQAGVWKVARDENKNIIPFSADTYMKNKRIYIKLGQLAEGPNGRKVVNGLGRYIMIVPTYGEAGNITGYEGFEYREG